MIFFCISLVVFSFYRIALYSLFFQQEEYDGKRFLLAVFRKLKLVDKKLSASLLIVLITNYILPDFSYYNYVIGLLFILSSWFDRNSIKTAKKALAVTIRLRRIWAVSFILLALLSLVLNNGLYLILFIQLLPFVLVFANVLLSPIENRIQNRIVKEVKSKLAELSPIIIGITGSYGKTSVKHILSHILSLVTPCLHTPGSVNTMMGISRVIREKLTKEHRYFLVEMGAYAEGSIRKLCEFVNPKHGILTAVGDAHYERFKSIENVAKAKFELGSFVKDGIFVINGYNVKSEFINKYGDETAIILEKDLTILDKKTTIEGIEFTFLFKGNTYKVKSPLFGLHHVENIALVILFCVSLGLDVDVVVEGLKTVPQITHRLEVIKQGMITYFDDAYNSNPLGFMAALDVLKVFKDAGKRTILVTPGMVELGDEHDKAHKRIGKLANEAADIVLAIIPERIKTFTDEIKNCVTFPDFKSAKAWIDENSKSDDVILFENDLPDLYESRISL